MLIEIKPTEAITLKYGDKEYVLASPKIGRVRDMSKRLKSAQNEDDQITAMSEFILACGVPQEVIDDWDMSQLSSFMKQLAGGEKKS